MVTKNKTLFKTYPLHLLLQRPQSFLWIPSRLLPKREISQLNIYSLSYPIHELTCSAPWKFVALFLQSTFVGLDMVSKVVRAAFFNDADIDVGTRTQIVENTGFDCLAHNENCLIPLIRHNYNKLRCPSNYLDYPPASTHRQVRLPFAFKYTHSCQWARSHCDVW